jgi:hypothetical protein
VIREMNARRVFAVVSAMQLAFSASASGIHAALKAFLKGQGRWIAQPEYSDRPRALNAHRPKLPHTRGDEPNQTLRLCPLVAEQRTNRFRRWSEIPSRQEPFREAMVEVVVAKARKRLEAADYDIRKCHE